MASTHSYFYSTDIEKQTLHRRLTPSERQKTEQKERWNDVRDYLIDHLAEKTELSVCSWLQGSYKFHTQIRPINTKDEMDIDLGIYFKWNGTREQGRHTALELKQMVQESLRLYAQEASTDVVSVLEPPKERCNRISFTGQFHIDVPVYHFNEESEVRSLATESGAWEDSDPKALYVWFQTNFSDEESNQVRRLIRYFKAWAALNLTNPPSSILITVLVSEAYLTLSPAELEGDDEALLSVANTVKVRLSNSNIVNNPVNKDENLNRLSMEDYFLFLQGLDSVINIGGRALEATSEATAASIWVEAFKHFFPAPASETATTENNKSLSRVLFVPQVRAVAHSQNNKDVGPWSGVNRLGPIPRGCSIKFTLTNDADLPQGSHVQWIVRNEGEEAEYKNDLGHPAGTNTRESEEHSAYNGSHYMDVIVTIPFQGVVGFARIPVHIEGQPVPPRNPKKPGYIRIQNKQR